jgi:hypothetical protein
VVAKILLGGVIMVTDGTTLTWCICCRLEESCDKRIHSIFGTGAGGV